MRRFLLSSVIGFSFTLAMEGLSSENKPLIEAQVKAVFDVPKPAFLSFNHTDSSESQSSNMDLLVTSFRPFGKDSVYIVDPTTGDFQSGLVRATWPNELKQVPASAFSARLWSVAGGFLVPGKNRGAITLTDLNGIQSVLTATRGKKWFYHQVEWVDVNQDGLLDILTARAHKPIIGKHRTELIWLENPGGAWNSQSPWQEHIITQGPGVHFQLLDTNPSSLTIVASEFFNEKLSIVRRQRASGDWERMIIDEGLGKAFDVEIVDLNKDGIVDLLVSNHQNDTKAGIFAYEGTGNFNNWKKHTLVSGIVSRQGGPGAGSPGSAFAFYPTSEFELGLPWIVAGGDASQHLHILRPTGEQWSYTHHELLPTDSTVGQVATADVDGDGITEIFVPAYDKNKIYVINLKEISEQSAL